jgi:hypothetical protein
MKPIKALFAVVPTLAIAGASFAGAGAANAAPGPTPQNNLAGACNMLNVNALPGMTGTAMTKNNQNGNLGMFQAVSMSGRGTCG